MVDSPNGAGTGPAETSESGKSARLDRQVAAGVAWTASAKWLTQLLSWASTIVVARLLSPADYGIVAMALVMVGVVQLLSEFGIGAAIVQSQKMSDDVAARIGGFAVILGFTLSLLLWVLSTPIASLFADPRVGPVTRVLGLSFFITSFRTVSTALLMREFAFKRLAALDVVESFALVFTTFVLAWGGYGYWALVIGQIAARFLGTVATVLVRAHRISIPLPFSLIRSEIAFGASVLSSKVAWYTYSNADFAIVGRLLGPVALGLYSYGWTLASIPVDRIYMLYQRVSGSLFSRLQREPAELRRYLLRLTEGASLLTFPASIGLAAVADTFVPVVIGSQWTAAVPLLQVLALASVLRSLDPLLAQLLVLTGHPRENSRIMTLAAVAMPALFLVGSRWGAIGVATAWLIGHPVIVLQRQLRYVGRIAHMPISDYFSALWPALSSSAIMATSVLVLQSFVESIPPPLSLTLQVLTGATVYVACLLGLHRERVARILLAVKKFGSTKG